MSNRHGTLDATVRLLSTEQALSLHPELFHHGIDDDVYFREIGLDGNDVWLDYQPELALVVTNSSGQIVASGAASASHLGALGYQVPE